MFIIKTFRKVGPRPCDSRGALPVACLWLACGCLTVKYPSTCLEFASPSNFALASSLFALIPLIIAKRKPLKDVDSLGLIPHTILSFPYLSFTVYPERGFDSPSSCVSSHWLPFSALPLSALTHPALCLLCDLSQVIHMVYST